MTIDEQAADLDAANEAAPYAGLTPDRILEAVDRTGLRTDGRLLSLNSYENRVFQVGLDDDARGPFVVAKFYRPARWSDEQILEEHRFTAELAEREIPVVPPLVLDGRTLHSAFGHRCSVFERRGGRAPNLDDEAQLEWLGRFIGRIHGVGSIEPYRERPTLDATTFGQRSLDYLLANDSVALESRAAYAGVAQAALDGVRECYSRVGAPRLLRLHGDCHEGNVLWTDAGPHFVDFDDSRMGPAVQDLWMLVSGDRREMSRRLGCLLDGYESFAEFDRTELHLVEALRTLRLLHHSSWIAERWNDPAFPAAFPWFGTPKYWEARIFELREQIAAMEEPPLAV
ncbi:serine/threonine protein kinase [soil metagenome]